MSEEEFQRLVIEQFAKLDNRLNEIEKDIKENHSDLNEKINTLGEKFDGLTENVNSLNDKYHSLTENVNSLNDKYHSLSKKFDGLTENVNSLNDKYDGLNEKYFNLNENFNTFKQTQDEIYLVVRAIEHSNKIGKAEIDQHNVRLAKNEGTLKKIAKVINDDIGTASNL